MSAVRSLCLLDVDGVLNALSDDPTLEKHRVQGFTLRLPHGIRDRVAVLEEHFDMVWSTTWWDEIEREIAPLYGFGKDWPVISFAWAVGSRGPIDKVPVVEKWLADHDPDRTICWIDDDPGKRVQEWALSRPAPTKLITPDWAVGLTDEQVADAVVWAQLP